MRRPEEGLPVGSINVSELSEEERVALGYGQENDETESEDLSKMYKADLVAKAEAAGYDVEGLKKEEIVELLEGSEQQ